MIKIRFNLIVTIENDAVVSKQVNVTASADFALSYEVDFGDPEGTIMMANIEEPISVIQENLGVVTDSTSLLTSEVPVVEVPSVEIPKPEVVANTSKIEEETPKKVKSGYEKYFPGIDNGKKILCYFVPGCDHCMDTAKELNEMRKKDNNFPPVFVIFMNEEPEKIPTFFEFAGR